MRTRCIASLFLIVGAMLAIACSQVVNNGDSGRAVDVANVDHGPPDGTLPGHDSSGVVVCAGATCAAGEQCCFANGRCFDPETSASACGIPPDGGSVAFDASTTGLCLSNADCQPSDFCAPTGNSLCLGPGQCISRATSCLGSNGPNCGCDGVNYPNLLAECLAGVRSARGDVCGVVVSGFPTPCGSDAQCPSGMLCCAITGSCLAADAQAACDFPPPGTRWPCIDSSQCDDDPHGGVEYCAGDGCTGLGGCLPVPRETMPCSGVVDQVCGCDGMTYVNECWAHDARTRVASRGACP